MSQICLLNCRCKQTALTVFDVFKAHRSEKVLNALRQANIKTVFVPACCTDELQPLDAIPNKLFKDQLKSSFNSYYADQVTAKLGENLSVNTIDIRTSVVKPLHARWIMQAFDKLSSDKEMFVKSFEKCGIVDPSRATCTHE